MNQPLVTISIPTFNSGKFLQKCLDAIKSQSYKNIEINIIDGSSTDNTLATARKYTSNIFSYLGALLGARNEGVKLSNGDYIVLLDSDQVLEEDSIKKAVSLIQSGNFDMLVFEEDVYSCKTFIEKMFHYDRKLIHSVLDFSPYTGVMLPRFYKADLIKEVFKKIDQELFLSVGGQDHAIIYYEAWQLSQRVNILRNAVKHIEPSSFLIIVKKFFRWGYTSVDARSNQYSDLINRKERFRKGLFQKGLFVESIGSIILLLIKGLPYRVGYYTGLLKKKVQKVTK